MLYPSTLSSLPDDVLLRIISATGPPGTQVSTAYRLGAVNQRFRQLLETRFLPGITVLSYDYLSGLSLSNKTEAKNVLARMFGKLSMVREVNLGGCPSALLTRKAVQNLVATAGDRLEDVNLAYCRVTDEVIAPLLQSTALKSLGLFGCNCLTGHMFVEYQVVGKLTSLDMSWVHGLTPEAVKAIARIKSLKNLKMTGVENLNGKTLRAFTTSDVRFSLTCMSLSYCPLRDAALYDLLSRATSLKKVILAESTGNLWGTGNFTEEGIERLKNKFPHVQIMFVT